MAKIKTTISIEESMMPRLKKQAKMNGMDVSSYIAHLIILVEKQQETKNMMQDMLKTATSKEFQNIQTSMLAQLTQNKGDE